MSSWASIWFENWGVVGHGIKTGGLWVLVWKQGYRGSWLENWGCCWSWFQDLECMGPKDSTGLKVSFQEFLFNYIQTFQFLKSHHLFLYIIEYDNISSRPQGPPHLRIGRLWHPNAFRIDAYVCLTSISLENKIIINYANVLTFSPIFL